MFLFKQYEINSAVKFPRNNLTLDIYNTVTKKKKITSLLDDINVRLPSDTNRHWLQEEPLKHRRVHW